MRFADPGWLLLLAVPLALAVAMLRDRAAPPPLRIGFPALGFLNVYPFRYSYVADHFQYLALLGILVPAAAGLTCGRWRERTPPGRQIRPDLARAVCGR